MKTRLIAHGSTNHCWLHQRYAYPATANTADCKKEAPITEPPHLPEPQKKKQPPPPYNEENGPIGAEENSLEWDD